MAVSPRKTERSSQCLEEIATSLHDELTGALRVAASRGLSSIKGASGSNLGSVIHLHDFYNA